LKGLDNLKKKHLRANAEFFKWDLALTSRKATDLMKKSRLFKIAALTSPGIKSMMEVMKLRGDVITEQIEEFFSYNIEEKDGAVVFEIFVDDSYFDIGDVLKKQMGKTLSRIVKLHDKKDMVDAFTEEIRKTYTKDYEVKILEK